MRLGFTKSKADSNLYYKVEDDGIRILLLYVDDLFLTGEENPISECKKKLIVEFLDERPWNDALLSKSWSMVVSRQDFSKLRKIRSRDPKDILEDRF